MSKSLEIQRCCKHALKDGQKNKEFTVHTDTKFQNLSTKSDGQLEYVYTLKAIVESTSQEEIELTDKLRRQKLMAIPESYSGCNKRQKKLSIKKPEEENLQHEGGPSASPFT